MTAFRVHDLLPGVASWTARRVVALVVLTGPLSVLYGALGMPSGTWWALPLTVVQGALAAGVVASYLPVPGAGLRLDVGCTPCAAVSGIAVLGSLAMRETDPWDAGISVTAALILGFGLVQRLRGTGTTCPTRSVP